MFSKESNLGQIIHVKIGKKRIRCLALNSDGINVLVKKYQHGPRLL